MYIGKKEKSFAEVSFTRIIFSTMAPTRNNKKTNEKPNKKKTALTVNQIREKNRLRMQKKRATKTVYQKLENNCFRLVKRDIFNN